MAPRRRATMDLEAYASRYSGQGKLHRMMLIAQKSPEQAVEALRIALEDVRAGPNVMAYRELVGRMQIVLSAANEDTVMTAGEGSDPLDEEDRAHSSPGNHGEPSASSLPNYMVEIDEDWITSVENKSKEIQEKIDSELNLYKSNLIKESIRMAHIELGDFHLARGNLSQALRSYNRAEDFLTNTEHTVQICQRIIRVRVDMQDYTNVDEYVRNALKTQPVAADPVIKSQLQCCSGLSALSAGRFKDAAQSFLKASITPLPEVAANNSDNSLSNLMSSEDVCIYGALCSLASLSRTELKEQVLSSKSFRQFLELVPEVRELLHDFHSSRYQSCLNALEHLRPDLEMELHLSNHVSTLYHKIRCKAIVQYSSPYVSVSLTSMAETLNTNVGALTGELVELIELGDIRGRIDMHELILYRKVANGRRDALESAAAEGLALRNQAEAAILRMSMKRYNMAVSSTTLPGGGADPDHSERTFGMVGMLGARHSRAGSPGPSRNRDSLQ